MNKELVLEAIYDMITKLINKSNLCFFSLVCKIN